MLSDSLDRKSNSFNIVRLVAAICVVISHAYVVRDGLAAGEPLLPLTPFTLGQHAVNGFFFISGLMLSLSLDRRPSTVRFVWARCLRIMPGLFVCGVVFAFALGPVMTNGSLVDYFGDAHTWLYPFSVIVQFARAIPPHGVFTSVPLSEVANDPLWTIKYELGCYLVLILLKITGLLRSGRALIVIAVLAAATVCAKPLIASDDVHMSVVHHISRFGLCFLLGVLAYTYRNDVPTTPWLLLTSFAIAVATTNTWFAPLSYILLVAHIALIVGIADVGAVSRVTRNTDISFGTYIYAWPTQQTIASLVPEMSVPSMIAVALAIVLPIALLSWVFVEKPILNLKQRYDAMSASERARMFRLSRDR